MKKIIIVFLFFFSIQSFGQKKDAYFVLKENDSKYVLFTENGEINKSNLFKIDLFNILLRNQYETYDNDLKKFKQELKELERNPTLEEYKKRPRLKSYDFKIISRKKIELKHQELIKLNLVDFEWLKENSWKENNPNILFEKLYFIYKIENDNYIEYDVERTVIIK